VVKNGQNSVYGVFEWPLIRLLARDGMFVRGKDRTFQILKVIKSGRNFGP